MPVKRTAILLALGLLLAAKLCAATDVGRATARPGGLAVKPAQLAEVVNIAWCLQNMTRAKVRVDLVVGAKITLTFQETGRVMGIASVNLYYGPFRLRQDGLIEWLEAFTTTRKGGPPILLKQEALYLETLASTTHAYQAGELLILENEDRANGLKFSRC